MRIIDIDPTFVFNNATTFAAHNRFITPGDVLLFDMEIVKVCRIFSNYMLWSCLRVETVVF